MEQGFLKVRRPETTGPCTRRQSLAHHVRIDGRDPPRLTARSLSMSSRCAAVGTGWRRLSSSTTSRQGTTGGSDVRAVHAPRRAPPECIKKGQRPRMRGFANAGGQQLAFPTDHLGHREIFGIGNIRKIIPRPDIPNRSEGRTRNQEKS